MGEYGTACQPWDVPGVNKYDAMAAIEARRSPFLTDIIGIVAVSATASKDTVDTVCTLYRAENFAPGIGDLELEATTELMLKRDLEAVVIGEAIGFDGG